MELILEKDGVWLDAIQSFKLDMAQGASENDFELEYDGDIERGSFVFVPGTSYGGVVDNVSIDSRDGVDELKHAGRTWEGILSSSIIQPSAGSAYYSVSGDVYDVLRALIARQGLGYAFTVKSGSYGVSVSYTFERYTDAYTGICKMLSSVNLVPRFEKLVGACVISVERPVLHSNDGFDDYRFELKIKVGRCVNHLICLGSGELQDRLVRHLYMDEAGNISQTQSIFGSDEWQEVYDYPSAESEEDLLEGAADRLRDAFANASSCEVTVNDGEDIKIGDVVKATSARTGHEVTAAITKTILTMDEQTFDVAYEVGLITR